MFFPWPGVFEQIRLADIYIHYDDTQLPRGRSFMSRVQIKTPSGAQWLTAPIARNSDQRILDTEFDESVDWRSKHLRTLQVNYARASMGAQMLDLAQTVYRNPTRLLADFNIQGIETITGYFGLRPEFRRSSDRPSSSTSSQRLLELLLDVNASRYITGHGARKYLNHELLEEHGIEVSYINYQRRPYPQLYGSFDPHVTVLDLIANMGPSGRSVLCSELVPWRTFLNGQT